jgi:hypothetical protein
MAPQFITEVAYSPDVIEFIRLLGRFKVRYLIVRGEAVIFHGYPRLTGDIDFFYERTPRNVARLFKALEMFWEKKIPGVKRANELLEPGLVVQFGRPPNRIDLHSQIDGVSFASAWRSRVPARLKTRSGSLRLFYIGIIPLLRNKRATARFRDLDDVEHLAPSRKRRSTKRKA